MKTFISTTALSAFLFTGYLSAQTDPVPFNMNANGNYSLNSWVDTSPAGTYPSNMIFHNMNSSPVTLSSSAASNVTGIYNSNAGTRINGLGANGIGVVNWANSNQTPSGYTTNALGEVVLALNTVGRTKIILNFTAGTEILGSNNSVSKLRVQYRVHNGSTWDAWKEASGTPVEYTSTLTAPTSQNFSSIVLPSDADDKANIQIRWLMYYSSGTINNGYKSPMIRLDDISVTSLPIVTIDPFETACSMDNAVPLTGGNPSGGTFSGAFVSNNTFNASAAGDGNHMVIYTYTDPHGMTNSSSENILVSTLGCETQLTQQYCNKSNLSLNDNIFVNPVLGAMDYEFEFSNQSLNYIETKRRGNPNPVIYLGSVPMLKYGETYEVRVRFRIGNQWSDFGPVCNITLQNDIPLTQLTNGYCGASGITLNTTIYTNPIAGATNYGFEFKNTNTNSVITRNRGNSNPLIFLGDVPGLGYGENYEVRVRSLVGGEWSQYGNPCNITIQNQIPVTQLTQTSCGANGLTLANTIYTEIVQGAVDYEFLFQIPATGFTVAKRRGNMNALMYLGAVPGLKYGQSYEVSVRANVNGIWGVYGPSCSISLINTIPTTQLASVSCGATGLSPTGYIYVDKVAGALDYEYEISCGSIFFSQLVRRGNNTNHLPLSYVQGLVDNLTYEVRVRSNVAGEWSAFGPTCEITIGNPSRNSEILTDSGKKFEISIYPNPSQGIFNISLEEKGDGILNVYNLNGQIVLSKNLYNGFTTIDLTGFTKGIYFVKIEMDGKVHYEKIIISD